MIRSDSPKVKKNQHLLSSALHRRLCLRNDNCTHYLIWKNKSHSKIKKWGEFAWRGAWCVNEKIFQEQKIAPPLAPSLKYTNHIWILIWRGRKKTKKNTGWGNLWKKVKKRNLNISEMDRVFLAMQTFYLPHINFEHKKKKTKIIKI